MPTCWHCKAETSAAHYDRIVNNKTALHGEWDGWRMSGRFLIAPGKAGRILPARLLGMLWAERHRSMTLPVQKPVVSNVIPAREVFAGLA